METIGIAQWRPAIDQAIRLCDVVLVVMGEQWLTIKDKTTGRPRMEDPNDMIRFEVGMALRCMANHERVIPVLLEDTEMPLPNALPEELRKLPEQNAFSLRYEGWCDDVQNLIDALRKVRPTRPKKLEGADCSRWREGDDVPNWIGCTGGEKALKRMVGEDAWRDRDFEVQFGGDEKNPNWFATKTFMAVAGEQLE